jgi:hypothetical protein
MDNIPSGAAEAPGGIALSHESLVAEAMIEFDEFSVHELEDFLRRYRDTVEGLTVTGLRPDLLKRIKGYLDTEAIPLAGAYDYIDEMREQGRQHIFLLHIQHAHRADLAALREKCRLFNDSLPSKPPRPALTGILLRGNELIFRWIETRRWQQNVNVGPNQISVVSHDERSVNFFSVDLASGHAAIRIQSLRSNPEMSVVDELEIYRKLVQERVNLDHFSPLVLEPVIRELLTSNKMKVQRWSIDWPGRGRLNGNVDPGFVEVVLLRFAEYVAQELAGDWLFVRRNAQRRVRATLDAKANEVHIPNRCDREEEHVILGDIRGVPRHKLNIRPLSDLADEHEEWRPALETFDVQFAIRGEREIDIQKAGKSWVVGPASVKAAQELVSRYPAIFKLRYRVRCPAGKPADGDARLYETIPESVDCRHKGKNISHATTDMIETVLVFEPPRETPQVIPKVAKAVEPLVPQKLKRRVVGAVTIVLFAVVYVPLVLGTAWLFLRLHERFDTKTGFLFVGLSYSIALLIELGAVIKLLGNPVTELALKVLLKLASLFRLRSSAEQPSKARVHRVGGRH